VLQTADGGFLVLGTCEASAERGLDVWLAKTDGKGDEQWGRTFGGDQDDVGRCLRRVPDPAGGWVLLGSTRSSGAGGWDVYLVKVDAAGQWEWEQTYGGSGDDCGWSVACTADGGYAIVGSTASWSAGDADVYLIKIKADPAGELDWYRSFGGPYSDGAHSVRQTTDGGFIIAGYTQGTGAPPFPSFAGDDSAWLIKTHANGSLEWQRVFGDIATSAEDMPGCLEQGRDVQLTADGGYLLAGYRFVAPDFDAWLIKADDQGQNPWYRTYGGGAADQAEAVILTAEGGYALAGMSRSVGPYEQAWLLKIDADGEQQGSRTFGGDGAEWGYCLRQTADGGYLLAGSTTSYGGAKAYLVYCEPDP